jgi:hypothetical protein
MYNSSIANEGLQMSSFISSKFTFLPKMKVLVTEMSTLDFGRASEAFHQIYPDSIDMGLTVISAKTGQKVNYVIRKEATEDHPCWILEPTPEDARRIPGVKGTSVKIFNT